MKYLNIKPTKSNESKAIVAIIFYIATCLKSVELLSKSRYNSVNIRYGDYSHIWELLKTAGLENTDEKVLITPKNL